jgi:hypothetical protein
VLYARELRELIEAKKRASLRLLFASGELLSLEQEAKANAASGQSIKTFLVIVLKNDNID